MERFNTESRQKDASYLGTMNLDPILCMFFAKEKKVKIVPMLSFLTEHNAVKTYWRVEV